MKFKTRLEVMERDDGICQICGRYTFAAPHHIIHGLGKKLDELYNLITLCNEYDKSCHWKVHFSNVPGEAEKYKQMCIQWSRERYGDKIIRLAKEKGRRDF